LFVDAFEKGAIMGNGFLLTEVTTALTSLNTMFGGDVATTRTKYGYLNNAYPNFLLYLGDTSDRRVWRKRTLRHAGFLLTSEVDFKNAAHPYPAKTFRRWLKWLTWLQMMAAKDATVKFDNVVQSNITPAQAIMDTLKAAIENASGTVHFSWSEGDMLTVEIKKATAPNYEIKVTSIKEPDVTGVVSDDEDRLVDPS
jgi:hypothetical protein